MDKMTNQDVSTTAVIPDNEIIARVLHGEKDLYGVIVRRYNQRLYRVAMSIINDDSEAEDVMQVAYISAYENLGKFAFKSSFSTWLTKILINESLLRLKRRGKSTLLNEDIISKHNYMQYTTGVRDSDTKTLNSELKSILEKAIQELPEKYRTVFIMREIEGLNVSDTQDCLDISEANVKVRLNRAKSLLKESLSAYYQKEDILHFHLSRCDRITENVLSRIKAYNL